MADNATITTAAEEESYLIAGLEQAILDGNEKQAEKLASDLFSGPPEDNSRRFELINQSIAGIGNTIHNNDEKTARGQAKKARQQNTIDAVLNTALNSINQQIDDLEKEKAGLLENIKINEETIAENNQTIEENKLAMAKNDKDSEKLEQENEKLEQDVEKIKEQTVEDKEKINEIAENIGSTRTHKMSVIKTLKPEAAKTLEDLIKDAKDLVTVKVDIPGQEHSRRHIVYKDENNEYYIKDPKDGEPVYFDKNDKSSGFSVIDDINYQIAKKGEEGLGNNAEPSKVASYEKNYKEFLSHLNSDEANAIRTEIRKIDDSLRGLQIKEHELDNKLQQDLTEIEKLEKSIKENDEQIAQNNANNGTLEDKNARLKDVNKDLAKDNADMAERITKINLDINNLKAEREQLTTLSQTVKDQAIDMNKTVTALNEKIIEMQKADASTEEITAALYEIDEDHAFADLFIELRIAKEEHAKAVEQEKAVEEDNIEVKERWSPEGGLTDRSSMLHDVHGFIGSETLSKIMPFSSFFAEKMAPTESIQFDGKDVYEENDGNLELYFWDEENQERIYLKDIVSNAEYSELKRRIHKDGELVKNETKDSKDPNNQFEHRYEAIITAKDITNSVEVVDKRAEEHVADCANKVDEAQEKYDIASGKTPEPGFCMAPGFATSSPMPASRHEDAGTLASSFNSNGAAPMSTPEKPAPDSTIDVTKNTDIPQTPDLTNTNPLGQ